MAKIVWVGMDAQAVYDRMLAEQEQLERDLDSVRNNLKYAVDIIDRLLVYASPIERLVTNDNRAFYYCKACRTIGSIAMHDSECITSIARKFMQEYKEQTNEL